MYTWKDLIPARLKCVDWDDVRNRAIKTAWQTAGANELVRLLMSGELNSPALKSALLAVGGAALSAAWNTIVHCRKKGRDCCKTAGPRHPRPL